MRYLRIPGGLVFETITEGVSVVGKIWPDIWWAYLVAPSVDKPVGTIKNGITEYSCCAFLTNGKIQMHDANRQVASFLVLTFGGLVSSGPFRF